MKNNLHANCIPEKFFVTRKKKFNYCASLKIKKEANTNMIAKDKTSLIYELRAPTWQSQSRKSPAEDESENKKEKKYFVEIFQECCLSEPK